MRDASREENRVVNFIACRFFDTWLNGFSLYKGLQLLSVDQSCSAADQDMSISSIMYYFVLHSVLAIVLIFKSCWNLWVLEVVRIIFTVHCRLPNDF